MLPPGIRKPRHGPTGVRGEAGIPEVPTYAIMSIGKTFGVGRTRTATTVSATVMNQLLLPPTSVEHGSQLAKGGPQLGRRRIIALVDLAEVGVGDDYFPEYAWLDHSDESLHLFEVGVQ